MRATHALAALAALLGATPMAAHEVLHSVERGRAVAVRAYESDGDALGDARYEVYSPADAARPYQEGRTDRNGWLAFVPDRAGSWRVRVFGEAGHGLDVRVDASAAETVAASTSSAALVLRPIAGAAAVGAVFVALWAAHRRRKRAV